MQIHDARPDLRYGSTGNNEGVSVEAVETLGGVASQLNVLALIVSDRNLVGVVQQNVCGHEGRVREEAREHALVVLLARLVFELGHAGKFAVPNGALHNPAELRVLGHMTLNKDGAYVRIQTSSEEHRCRFSRFIAQDGRVTAHGERVEIDHTVEAVLRLVGDPSHDRTHEVAEVFFPGWLDAGKNAGHGRSILEAPSHAEAGNDRPVGAPWPEPAVCAVSKSSSEWAPVVCVAVSIDVSTPVFEGPFDLLLNLIAKEQVDLYEVSLSGIVDAFVREIELMKTLDLEVATEFLLIAATLIELKLRRLLPERATVDLDEELALLEERDLLLAKLLEYQTFRGAAAYLRRIEAAASQSYPRTNVVEERFAAVTADPLAGSTPEQLRDAFRRVVAKLAFPKDAPTVQLDHVTPVRVTVAEAVSELAQALPRLGHATFRMLTVGMREPAEIIVRFLAVLELYKQGWVELDQAASFGDLHVRWRPDGPESMPVDAVFGSFGRAVPDGAEGERDGDLRAVDLHNVEHHAVDQDVVDQDEDAQIDAELDASIEAAREARLSAVEPKPMTEPDAAGVSPASFAVDDYEG